MVLFYPLVVFFQPLVEGCDSELSLCGEGLRPAAATAGPCRPARHVHVCLVTGLGLMPIALSTCLTRRSRPPILFGSGLLPLCWSRSCAFLAMRLSLQVSASTFLGPPGDMAAQCQRSNAKGAFCTCPPSGPCTQTRRGFHRRLGTYAYLCVLGRYSKFPPQVKAQNRLIHILL